MHFVEDLTAIFFPSRPGPQTQTHGVLVAEKAL